MEVPFLFLALNNKIKKHRFQKKLSRKKNELFDIFVYFFTIKCQFAKTKILIILHIRVGHCIRKKKK